MKIRREEKGENAGKEPAAGIVLREKRLTFEKVKDAKADEKEKADQPASGPVAGQEPVKGD